MRVSGNFTMALTIYVTGILCVLFLDEVLVETTQYSGIIVHEDIFFNTYLILPYGHIHQKGQWLKYVTNSQSLTKFFKSFRINSG